MAGSHSRNKGARFETEVVNALRKHGCDAERVPLSGAVKGTWDKDIRLSGYYGEAKRKANGWKSVYDALERDNADFLAIRADRKPRLYVLTEETFLSLLRDAGLAE
jgi:hypothetical protein